MTATQSRLNKVKVGDTILAAPGREPELFEFGRPKDTNAVPHTITAIDTEADEWSGKKYVVTIDDGRKSDDRYGTTHVYVAGAPALPGGTADRCAQCKSYGVVRGKGPLVNQHYRTKGGAEQATVKGNSVECPKCKGTGRIAVAA